MSAYPKSPLGLHLTTLTDRQIDDLCGWWQGHLSDVIAGSVALSWGVEAIRQGEDAPAIVQGQWIDAVFPVLADLIGVGQDLKARREADVERRFISPRLTGLTARQIDDLGEWWSVGQSDVAAIAVAAAWVSEAERQGRLSAAGEIDAARLAVIFARLRLAQTGK